MTNYSKYLAVNEADEKWGFYTTGVGCAHIPSGNGNARSVGHFSWDMERGEDTYCLVFIANGEGVFESGLTPATKLKAGTCVILFPGIRYSYQPDLQSSGRLEYWVEFKGPYPTMLMSNGFFKPEAPFFHVAFSETIRHLFEQLIETERFSNFNCQAVLCGISLQILGCLNIISNHPANDLNNEAAWIEKVKAMIRNNLEQVISYHEMLKEIPIGYSTLRKLFKSYTGLSISQYYMNARLANSLKLMETTNLSIKEIAYRSGFESQLYFSKAFKKKYCFCPSAFRNSKN